MKKNILKIMIGTVIAEVLVICYFILFGKNNDIYSAIKISLSVGIVFCYTIPCLFYSRIYDNEKYKKYALIGSCLVLIASIFSILHLWDIIPFYSSDSSTLYSIDNTGEMIYEKVMFTLNSIISILALFSWFIVYLNANKTLDKFVKGSLIISAISCLYFNLISWIDPTEGFLIRLMYVLYVLSFGSIIITFILSIIHKKEIKEIRSKNAKEVSNSNTPIDNIQIATNNINNEIINNEITVNDNNVQNNNISNDTNIGVVEEPVNNAVPTPNTEIINNNVSNENVNVGIEIVDDNN